jgi:glycosyltransferase involved in cell wall biosynthesis
MDAAPLRILHVVSHLDPRMGGSIMAALQIADCVQSPSVECTVVGTAGPGSRPDDLRAQFPRLTLRTWPNHFPRHSFASRPFRRWLYEHVCDYDVVHSHGLFNFPYLHGGMAARARGVPLIVSPHNSLDPYDLRKKRLPKRWWYGPRYVRPMLQHASCVLCTARMEADQLETYGVAVTKPILPLPVPAPPTVGTAATAAQRAAFRASHGMPHDATCVLFLSRFDRKKGLELALAALAHLAGTMPKLYLCVAGTGSPGYGRTLRSVSRRLDVDDRVRWLGFAGTREKGELYRVCDAFILPSYNENFGIVLIEALYHGLALVVSDRVYITPVLKDAGVALVCSPEVESVRLAVSRAVTSTDWRERVRRDGRRIAEELYGPSRLRAAYTDLYRSVGQRRDEAVTIGASVGC